MVQIERVYAAGACNISKEEEGVRLASGWLGTAITVALGVVFSVFGVPALWRLTLFLPAALAASGFLQAGFHFCARYGMMGVFNVGHQIGSTQTVEDAEFATKDKAKALQIFGLSTLVGIVAAVVGYFLP